MGQIFHYTESSFHPTTLTKVYLATINKTYLWYVKLFIRNQKVSIQIYQLTSLYKLKELVSQFQYSSFKKHLNMLFWLSNLGMCIYWETKLNYKGIISLAQTGQSNEEDNNQLLTTLDIIGEHSTLKKHQRTHKEEKILPPIMSKWCTTGE